MDFLTEPLTEYGITAQGILGSVGIVKPVLSVISAIIGGVVTYTFYILRLRRNRKEQVRQEIIRLANPILSTIEELEGRLIYILEKNEYHGLNEAFDTNCYEGLNEKYRTIKERQRVWSGSYKYYMPSTVYLFGQYFAWIRILEENLRDQLFESQKEKDELFDHIDNVGKVLREPPGHFGESPCIYRINREDTGDRDRQVFQLEQRALGELLIHHENGSKRCMSYREFFDKWEEGDPAFKQHLKPFVSLLGGLSPLPKNHHRWRRLQAVRERLCELRDWCEKLLKKGSSKRIIELKQHPSTFDK